MEYAPRGELYKSLQKQEHGRFLKKCVNQKLSSYALRFVESQAALYISQMADALTYCHSKKVIHR